MTSLTIPGVELLNQLPVDFFNRMSSNLPDAAAATVAFASRHPPPPHGATLKSMLLCPLHRKTAPKRTLFKVTAGSSTPFLLLPVKINVWAAGPPFIWTVTFQRPSLPVRACLKAMTSSGWKHSPYQHLKWLSIYIYNIYIKKKKKVRVCILSFSYGRVRVAVDGKRDTSADGRKSPYKGAFCCSFPAQRVV